MKHNRWAAFCRFSKPQISVGADLRVCPGFHRLAAPGTRRSAPTLKRSIWGLMSLLILIWLSLTSPRIGVSAQESLPPYKDPSLPIEKRVDDLVSRMTLEEKVSQMINAAAPIERLGVPALCEDRRRSLGYLRQGGHRSFLRRRVQIDGVRLYLDGKLLVDAWTGNQASQIRTVMKDVNLEAGRSYDVRIEYYEDIRNAIAKFFW